MNKWDRRFLELARLVSTWSKDPSTQTGAVIVRPDKSVASIGFNGFPVSMPDHDGLYHNREEKYSRIIHCEMNALNFSNDNTHKDYTLYTWPFLSCDRCAVHMIQAGITRFVAPQATEEQLTRWGDAFNRTRGYIEECGATIDEYPMYLMTRSAEAQLMDARDRIKELNEIITGDRPDLFHDSLVRGSRVMRMEETVSVLKAIVHTVDEEGISVESKMDRIREMAKRVVEKNPEFGIIPVKD